MGLGHDRGSREAPLIRPVVDPHQRFGGVAAALAARRSCRSFSTDPLPAGQLDDLLDRARRTPTAGNAQGVEFLVLDTPDAVEAYWSVTLPDERRAAFPWPGLLHAPALVVPYGVPDRYLDRYAEPDKAAAGLGGDADSWPVPYWLVDASFAAMALQLLVVDAGLACCVFGQFDHEPQVAARFGVPDGCRAIGTIAVGWAADDGRPSASTARKRRPLDEVVHRGRWADAERGSAGK